MLRDELVNAAIESDHITFSDGHTFHVLSGRITSRGAACSCGRPEPVHKLDTYREAVPQLQLSLTDSCNMGCTYCSFRDRVHADGKPVTIPLETVMQGISAHRERLSADEEEYTRVDFGLAGETMLVRHLHDQVHTMVEEGLADSPITVVWAGPMVTNATLSLDPDLADRLGPPQDISLDGPKPVHDRVRFYTNGRGGTYDHVRSVLDRVLANHPDMGVSAVLTAYCTDFVAIFRHLFEEVGARNIYMKPVNATHDKDYALNAQTLADFQRGYADLVEHILAQPPEGILARLLALNSEDFFMRFFYRVKDRAAQVYRCGAGKSGTYLDTNGKLYPCAHFIGKSGWDIGHATTGVDPAARRRYLDLVVDERDSCSGCSARYVCGGGCYYQAVLANEDIATPDQVKCELIRFITQLAIRLAVNLRQQHPEVLDALPSPFGIAPEAVGAGPDSPYQPVGQLESAAEQKALIALGGPGRVRGGLLNPPCITATLSVTRQGLAIVVDLGDEPAAVDSVRLQLQPTGSGRFTMRDLAVQAPGGTGELLKVTRHEARWLQAPSTRFRRTPHPPVAWTQATDVQWSWDAREIWLGVPHDAPGLREEAVGLNLHVYFTDGGWTSLVLHEPFVLLPDKAEGLLCLTGPEAAGPDAEPHDVNGRMPAALVPLGRWAGLQGNTC